MKINPPTPLPDPSQKMEELKRFIEQQKSEIFCLHNVVENFPGSIYWKDREGFYLGRSFYLLENMQITHFKASNLSEDIIGKTDYDLFPTDVADAYRKTDMEVMKSGEELVTEETIPLPNGETRIQLSSKKPFKDEKDNIVGVVGNILDVTLLRRTEAELRKAELTNTTKTEFIRNMEHDLRTPFAGIWGLTEILYEQETDSTKKEFLNDVRNCAKELLDYCSAIIAFAKSDHENREVLAKKFNLSDVINGIIKIELPPAKNKQLDLILNLEKTIPPILIGDEYRLKSILINLISNAIKFTKNGYVKLSVKPKEQTEENILIQFIVEDTGFGISQDGQDFINGKFLYAVSSNQENHKKLGLGFPAIKQFIEEMNGNIHVKTEPGKGSIFTCTFPFKLPLSSQE